MGIRFLFNLLIMNYALGFAAFFQKRTMNYEL